MLTKVPEVAALDACENLHFVHIPVANVTGDVATAQVDGHI